MGIKPWLGVYLRGDGTGKPQTREELVHDRKDYLNGLARDGEWDRVKNAAGHSEFPEVARHGAELARANDATGAYENILLYTQHERVWKRALHEQVSRGDFTTFLSLLEKSKNTGRTEKYEQALVYASGHAATASLRREMRRIEARPGPLEKKDRDMVLVIGAYGSGCASSEAIELAGRKKDFTTLEALAKIIHQPAAAQYVLEWGRESLAVQEALAANTRLATHFRDERKEIIEYVKKRDKTRAEQPNLNKIK